MCFTPSTPRGTFRVCETAPPTDTFLISQQCFNMQLGWNQMFWPTFTSTPAL
jgi:hypothetical protein